jgi:hypothetical protein
MGRYALLACVVVAMAVFACGGDDGKKVRQSCADDATCGGGVCFEQECYEACSETSPCADDEVCVRKEKAGAEVDLCVVAADYLSEHEPCVNSQPDCDDLVRGVCQIVGCHDSACVVEPMTDGIECVRADGEPDVCKAGVCGERVTPTTCDTPAGTWRATIAHPENEGVCAVDGQVTQVVTLTITPGADGTFSASVETTNNVDYESGECFTHREEWTGGIFEGGTVTLEKESETLCDGQPVDWPTVYGFQGALSADCTQIAGASWKEPADACNPESGRFDIPGVVFEKVTSTPIAAFR